MSLSAAELEAVVNELRQLVGAAVQKIRAPTPRTVVLELRQPGRTVQLLLSAEPDEARLHVAAERPPSAEEPMPIQNLLRAHVLPARLLAIDLLPGDRVVRLAFEAPVGPRVLVAELTGRHGNLFLLGPDDRVLGAGTSAAGGTRELHAGRAYEPPPSPPGGGRERPPRFGVSGAAGDDAFPISARIEATYGPLVRERDLARLRRDAGHPLRAALSRTERALEKLAGDAARAEASEELRERGDLLKTMLARVPRGAKSVVATDWSTGEAREVTIPLSPELSAKANLEKLYKQYRRLSSAKERIAARRADLEGQRERLSRLGARLAAANSEAELLEVAREAQRLGARAQEARGKRTETPARPPYRAFVSAGGSAIWVGRGARQNDQLTFHVARGNDAWLHARGVPGAHVIVPLPRGGEPDGETLLDACALAVHHSGHRGETVSEVAVTHKKYVRKPKGSAPGAVLYDQDRTVLYRHDEERIARLLAQPDET